LHPERKAGNSEMRKNVEKGCIRTGMQEILKYENMEEKVKFGNDGRKSTSKKR